MLYDAPLACVCVWWGGGGHRDIVLKLNVWIPREKIADTYFNFFELSPLVKLRPFEKQGMKFCKCSISKRIKARNLSQLIGRDE